MRKFVTIVFVFFVSLTPLAAQAHDEILSSTPASGSAVDAGKFDVTVTFEENIMVTENNQGLVIEVTDPSGTKVSNGCVSAEGATLSTPVDLDSAGTYHVSWRSIGSDGHAVEGDFEFDLVNDAEYRSSGIPAISAECAASKQIAGSAEDATSQIGLAIAIALVAIGSVIGALRFAKQAKPKE